MKKILNLGVALIESTKEIILAEKCTIYTDDDVNVILYKDYKDKNLINDVSKIDIKKILESNDKIVISEGKVSLSKCVDFVSIDKNK
jgi:hypothetical protein